MESDVLYFIRVVTGFLVVLFLSVSYLDQQSDGATLVHLQDLSILGPHKDVAMAQRYGTYRGVVLQEQPCTVDELKHKVRDPCLSQDSGSRSYHFS